MIAPLKGLCEFRSTPMETAECLPSLILLSRNVKHRPPSKIIRKTSQKMTDEVFSRFATTLADKVHERERKLAEQGTATTTSKETTGDRGSDAVKTVTASSSK